MRKILPYIFIFIILVGLFSPAGKAQADNCTATSQPADCIGQCITFINNVRQEGVTQSTKDKCVDIPAQNVKRFWYATDADLQNRGEPVLTPPNCTYDTAGKPTNANPSCLDAQGNTVNASGASVNGTTQPAANQNLFGVCDYSNFTISGCIVSFFYWVFLVLPSGILYLVAYVFNAMLALTLGTILYNNNFLPEAWRIVRDFSNIFFILILLYIAIKMILGLGGAEIKKMIVQVIIAALLINFSMFMTEVVIDSSNILALIFYNKITINHPGPATAAATGVQAGDTGDNYTSTLNPDKTGVKEKDIAGMIVSGFDPSKFLNAKEINDQAVASSSPGLLQQIRDWTPGGTISPFHPISATMTQARVLLAAASWGAASGGSSTTLPVGIALLVIFTSGAVYLFAAYAFFVAALAFIGRLIELWMCIIFSPVAFLSLTMPQFEKLHYFGWDAWLKRLLSVGFMAPTFMFSMLIISKLVQTKVFSDLQNTTNGINLSLPHLMAILTIPAIIYITLLHKATNYAKKYSGEFGEAAVKYGSKAAGLAGGLALGAASGGATTLLGGVGGTAISGLGKKAGNNFVGNKLQDWGGFLQNKTFDPRNIKSLGIGAGLTKAGLGKGNEGSWTQTKKQQVENRQKRAEELDKRWSTSKQAAAQNAENQVTKHVMETEVDMYTIDKDGNQIPAFNGQKIPMKLALEEYDKQMDRVRKEIQDLRNAGKEAEAEELHDTQLKEIKKQKEDLRNIEGKSGKSVKKLEEERNLAKSEAESVSYSVRDKYATSLEKGFGRAKGITKNVVLGATGLTGAFILKGGLLGGAIGTGVGRAYSTAADNEAARKIRANIKVDSGEKAH